MMINKIFVLGLFLCFSVTLSGQDLLNAMSTFKATLAQHAYTFEIVNSNIYEDQTKSITYQVSMANGKTAIKGEDLDYISDGEVSIILMHDQQVALLYVPRDSVATIDVNTMKVTKVPSEALLLPSEFEAQASLFKYNETNNHHVYTINEDESGHVKSLKIYFDKDNMLAGMESVLNMDYEVITPEKIKKTYRNYKKQKSINEKVFDLTNFLIKSGESYKLSRNYSHYSLQQF